MKNTILIKAACLAVMAISSAACSKPHSESFDSIDLQNFTGEDEASASVGLSLSDMARMFAALPIELEQVEEVHDAAVSSTEGGYDEEYTLSNLINAPGHGVKQTKAARAYSKPLRELLEEFLSSNETRASALLTKAGVEDAQAFLDKLSASDLQIYWPYSEDWDGETLPIITFDPGYGSEYNYGYRIRKDDAGLHVVDSIYVDEDVAKSCPVWVVNTNDDAAYTPVDLFVAESREGAYCTRGGAAVGCCTDGGAGAETKAGTRTLIMDSFCMQRHYDSWFRGASEFFIKCGGLDGFSASTEAELKLYQPSVSDFLVVVQRKYLKVPLQFNAIIMTNFTNQMENLAFLITEDDGGTVTSWKCSATVKIKSKSYGFDIEIPYHEKDDIVWRGQLSTSFFQSEDIVTGRFGDVIVSFTLQ